MKKIFTGLLAMVLVFSLAGCGNTKEDNTGSNNESNDIVSYHATGTEGTGEMSDFSARTLSGSTFTQENLTPYDLTMVNIWTTWCGYCIAEMPELQKVYKNLPKNVNMISICCDADSETDSANEILDKNNCTFETLIPDDKLTDSILNQVSGYPTTIFVDKNGNVVGNVQLGAPSAGDDVSEAYLNLINQRLEQVN